MHTAIHSIAVFSVESVAVELFNILKEYEEMPYGLAFPFDPANFVEIREIDYRKPPTTFGDPDDADSVPLEYVNYPQNNIPDVYGY